MLSPSAPLLGPIGAIWAHFFAHNNVMEADVGDYFKNRVSEKNVKRRDWRPWFENHFLAAYFPEDKDELGDGKEEVLSVVEVVREPNPLKRVLHFQSR